MKRRIFSSILTVFLLLSVFTFGLATEVAAATTWEYTSLGDSLGTGFGAWYGYVPRYRDHMGKDTGNNGNLTNLSQNGWTSSDLLYALQTDSTFRSSVASADVVTWDIGGNDLREARNKYLNGTCGGTDNEDCLRETVATFKNNWFQIVGIIQDLRNGQTTNYKTINVYNPYVNEDKDALSYDGTVTRFEVFKPYLDQINQYIDAQQTLGYEMADVYTAFNGPNHNIDPEQKGYIWIDGLHPNDTGHKVIAEELRRLGYDPLR
ncbi:spore germination lipase LipC [Marinithermofilum abyssi]|uniref:Spore germination lipase LipC n=1 Tax=Marinithermofilum abyssi TaxID=1571185 RepID=A0A8J2VEK6_9BACL|nr:SGNH/GDSL hydrolase family protein [Marinithermofilum abyssi]GGE08821.1 spore germination lipase LipC [Marinithermofilum abyssi]